MNLTAVRGYDTMSARRFSSILYGKKNFFSVSILLKYTLNQIQSITGGRIVGPPDTIITGLAGIEAAKAGDASFIKDDTLIPQAVRCGASALVTHREIPELKKPHVAVENPFRAFTRLMEAAAIGVFSKLAKIYSIFLLIFKISTYLNWRILVNLKLARKLLNIVL